MSVPSKTAISTIATSDAVSPAIANQPHTDLETNVDAILAYLAASTTGYFEQDTSTTTALTFGYLGGLVRADNTITIVSAGTTVLADDATNYVEITGAGTLSDNASGFTSGSIPLWQVTTVSGAITAVFDKRSWITSTDASDLHFTPAGDIAATDVQAAITELETDLKAEDGFIRTFIGKGSAGSETPAYTNENYVTDGESLETAVSNLDGQIKTNSDALAAIAGPAGVTKQTVLTGSVDTDGISDFISAGSGLACDLAATTTDPVVVSLSAGYGSIGPVDYHAEITSDIASAWSGLTANATNYLYMDRDSGTGDITYGATTNLPPIYGSTYIKAFGVGRAYSSFDGSDAATAFTDANGNAWTFSGNAQLDTAQKKFGTTSVLLDGTGDYLTNSNLVVHAGENEGGFELSSWFRVNGTGAEDTIVGATTSYSFRIDKSSGEVLKLYVSSNGSTWNIAAGTGGALGTTTISASTWYRVRFIWDGASYKLYLSNNGAAETEECSVTSSTAFTIFTTGIRYGNSAAGTSLFDGWLDEFSYSVGPQTVGTETPAATARGALEEDNEHLFDMNTFKMKYWDQATQAYIEKQRVFLGEAVTDGSTVTGVITYALRGEYESDRESIIVDTDHTINHNLGIHPKIIDIDLININPDLGYLIGDKIKLSYSNSVTASSSTTIYNSGINTSGLVTDNGIEVNNKSSGAGTNITLTKWEYQARVFRGW